ncbi:hypothetical protein Pth03_65950 [Planotetraspora thailandica]|uniref:DUF2231 domain-containing protein n=1 Tax=Planotetraspora thailandica TaxID=487172 RepID=A0A8J3XZU8_9ACTN|nr:DUF2231 domain-containing protein [Planotetraspora thailandica]GII58206.1 hypothetical protein Pth03_65950 [Planotetraspora thailandica]
MFDQILGLPAHPLIIHAAVVLTPLLVVLSIAYAVLPAFRRRLDWAVVLTAIAAPAAVFGAKESGEELEARLFKGQIPQPVLDHSSFANPLFFSTLGLGVVALVLVYLTRPVREPGTAATGSARAVSLVLSVLAVVLALVVAYYVFRAGDSGARAVWGS